MAKTKIKIPVEMFVDKDKTDALRVIWLNTPLSIKDSIKLLQTSKDYKRDTPIIHILSCKGYSFNRLYELIVKLND